MQASPISIQPFRVQGLRVAALLATGGLFLAYGPAFVSCERLALGYMVGIARHAQGANLALLGICSAAGLAVLVLILYSIGTFRAAGQPGSFRLRPFRELLWALVPVGIVIALALPSIQPLVAAGGNVTVPAAALAEASYSCRITR